MSTTHHGEDRVPVPPTDAQQFTTVCSYCIVGCGYRVFKWPQGQEGGPKPHQNALQTDFTKQQAERSGKWISSSMHSVVTERDGRRYHVAVLPDSGCVVNNGNHSIRGGTHGSVLYGPDRPTADRLSYPLIYRGGNQLPTTWEEAIELGAHVMKTSLDKWGPDAIAMKFFDHGGGAGDSKTTGPSASFSLPASVHRWRRSTTVRPTIVKCSPRAMPVWPPCHRPTSMPN